MGLREVFKPDAAYDLSVPFGFPFVMVVKGGAIVVRPEIVWNGVAANVLLLLWIAAVAAWLWHKIASASPATRKGDIP